MVSPAVLLSTLVTPSPAANCTFYMYTVRDGSFPLYTYRNWASVTGPPPAAGAFELDGTVEISACATTQYGVMSYCPGTRTLSMQYPPAGSTATAFQAAGVLVASPSSTATLAIGASYNVVNVDLSSFAGFAVLSVVVYAPSAWQGLLLVPFAGWTVGFGTPIEVNTLGFAPTLVCAVSSTRFFVAAPGTGTQAVVTTTGQVIPAPVGRNLVSMDGPTYVDSTLNLYWWSADYLSMVGIDCGVATSDTLNISNLGFVFYLTTELARWKPSPFFALANYPDPAIDNMFFITGGTTLSSIRYIRAAFDKRSRPATLDAVAIVTFNSSPFVQYTSPPAVVTGVTALGWPATSYTRRGFFGIQIQQASPAAVTLLVRSIPLDL